MQEKLSDWINGLNTLAKSKVSKLEARECVGF